MKAWEDTYVRTRAERNTVRAVGQRPDFGNQDPRARTPRVSEMDDKQPDHDDGCPASGLVSFPLVLIFGDDDGLRGVSG